MKVAPKLPDRADWKSITEARRMLKDRFVDNAMGFFDLEDEELLQKIEFAASSLFTKEDQQKVRDGASLEEIMEGYTIAVLKTTIFLAIPEIVYELRLKLNGLAVWQEFGEHVVV